jgi:hypothetical protein
MPESMSVFEIFLMDLVRNDALGTLAGSNDTITLNHTQQHWQQ